MPLGQLGRHGTLRVAIIGPAVRQLLIVLLGFLLAATACGGGDSSPGMRVNLFDDLYFSKTGGSGREFRGSCPPGRFMVEFRSGEDLTLKSSTRVVASLTSTEAFIGCSDARIHKPRQAQGLPYIVRRDVAAKDSTQIVCATGKRINIRVTPTYKFHDSFAGGYMVVWTRPDPHQRWGRALVVARFEEDEDSRLISEFSYHSPRCRGGRR